MRRLVPVFSGLTAGPNRVIVLWARGKSAALGDDNGGGRISPPLDQAGGEAAPATVGGASSPPPSGVGSRGGWGGVGRRRHVYRRRGEGYVLDVLASCS